MLNGNIFYFLKTKKGVLLTSVLLLLEILYVHFSVKITDWNKVFFDLLQSGREFTLLDHFISLFNISFIVISLYTIAHLLNQIIALIWRKNLMERLTNVWLFSHEFTEKRVSNPDQRLTEDINHLTKYFISLFNSSIRAVLAIIIFSPILFNISSKLNIFPGFLIIVSIFIAVINSFLSHLIFSKPTQKAWYQNESNWARLREHFLYVSHNSDSVSIYRGQEFEKTGLIKKLEKGIKSFNTLIKIQSAFIFIKNILGKFLAVAGYFILAPFYFKGLISYGDMAQTTTIIFFVTDAFNFFANNITDISYVKAMKKRISELEKECLKENKGELNLILDPNHNHLSLDSVNIYLDNQTLLQNINIIFKPGEKILLKGPNGSGKTTLFKTIAGIHKNADGKIIKNPNQKEYFSSNAPYITIDNNLQEIAYEEDIDSENIIKSLKKVGLNEEKALNKNMSLGEKQRLCIARLLSRAPKHQYDYIFLDEPISHMSHDDGVDLLKIIFNNFSMSCIVIISHDHSLEELFSQTINILDFKK